MKIRQRGFTLVEVLIVVVIIAILAALILPRLTSQTENGYLAEAQHMLGAMRRAQSTHCDLTECGTTYSNDWQAIGLNSTNAAPSASNWTYALVTTGTNTAVRANAVAPYNGRTITLNNFGAWSCGTYTSLASGRGCKA